MDIHISRVHFPVTTLGPGKRIGIWLQGCTIHCKGCISMDTWQFNINKVPLNDLKQVLEVWLPQCDGITISGGEPFDQENALFELLEFLNSYKTNILVYSGFSFETLKEKELVQNGFIDVLISEPYNHTETQTKRLLGSDNQQVHFLTPLGKREFATYLEQPLEKELDIHITEETVWLAGIPINGMKEITQAGKDNNVDLSHSQAVTKTK
ncbi:anaerobic ribonucleoside-triphosphate reductase activating protein [Maribacter caenipelagi]|uniref:Anaerobic ribonucleoside-triphosphate reductase activating protein n=1 Tax=Maribacter caenipelagi TaxID=1447781 RepID=A0A4R7D1J3_9FLAO|nr:4Fe-4S single cluster domain-containing protein [Maribacter caenipelagi]TDS14197.1 anaerobic ribonucleoside-triphosphate reductase activating protein [Maribacter caenipelagi]